MSTRRRTGKIARLPFAVREQLNQRLRDNRPVEENIGWLVAQGFGDDWLRGEGFDPGWNATNFTHWTEPGGGYEEWLRDQARLDDLRLKREAALRIAGENSESKVSEAALHLAASQIFEVLTDFDVATLKETLTDRPEGYSELLGSLARIAKPTLDFTKYRDQVREVLRRETEQAKSKDPAGLTAETLERIERELNLR